MNLDPKIYWILFSLALVVAALWEMARPWRGVSLQLVRRWRNHAVLLFGSTAILALIFRGSAALVAVAAQNNRFGLLKVTALPLPARIVLGILLLDLFGYAMHRLYHAVPVLWRVHQVHHSDAEVDLSTGIRHHPFENLITHAFTLGAIVLLAPPAAAVVVLQALGVCQIFFSHANANMPRRTERLLRLIFVTPEMHRIHHSDEMRDQNANLGELFACWDRLFGTYLDASVAGVDGMRIGMKGCEGAESAGIAFMLAQPFRSAATEPQSIPEPVPARTSGD